jgi:Na+/H+ antiporter NhaD/arsenite permease-like protein
MFLTAVAIIFALGYIAIALEHVIKVNKAAVAMFLGTLLWLIWFNVSIDTAHTTEQLFHCFGELAQILFFLIGAMTIVAIVDANDGFSIITSRIRTNNIRTLLWTIAWITFILSAILDNLTSTIVMITLMRKIVEKTKVRLYLTGLIVIAANSGGAWSPIGDVTTTMLWIGGQISALGIIKAIILPSAVSLLVPLVIMSIFVKGKINYRVQISAHETPHNERNVLFIAGVGGLLMVPVIKTVFHVPPYIAMLFILGILWTTVELLGRKHGVVPLRLSASHIIRDVDVPSVLFFAGILLAVGVLGATGQLASLAIILENKIGNLGLIVFIIGFISAVLDNVPLVAAAMKMYSIEMYPVDNFLWEFISYAAGVGGSMLVIGSAAGVAAMGLDKNLSFGWYLKKITPLAMLGYVAGAGTYLLFYKYVFNALG